MIRNGLQTEEIARLRGVSAATINRHREHIRRKMKIKNQKINLTTYLQSLLATDPSDLPALTAEKISSGSAVCPVNTAPKTHDSPNIE